MTTCGLIGLGAVDGLVVDTTVGCCGPLATNVVVRGDHVHAFPLRLPWSVLRVVGVGWLPIPWPPEGLDLVDALKRSGDIYLAIRREFFIATDTWRVTSTTSGEAFVSR